MASALVTFSELQEAQDVGKFINKAIGRHMGGELYQTAVIAKAYMRQRNVTISEFHKVVRSASGNMVNDPMQSHLRIKSNLFKRLVVQRMTYSLGNGCSFVGNGESGEDKTKEMLGSGFDDAIMELGLYGIYQGLSFAFWDYDHIKIFHVDEFVPIWDEHTGSMEAGIRFWQIDQNHDMVAVLYEKDGFTEYVKHDDAFAVSKEKRAYVITKETIPADGVTVVTGGRNYGSLPIIPFWGSDAKQSALVGIRDAIDAYDLIKSGLANDVHECAEIYWIVENAGGMTDKELSEYLERLNSKHIANADTSDGGAIKPYTQDVPTDSRVQTLKQIKSDLYEDWGGLDVHTISAGATNDHIEAGYQPVDEEADEFERLIRTAIISVLRVIGIEDVPIFTRNRIANERERVEMVMLEAPYLDRETVLRKLPNIEPDEIPGILDRTEGEDVGRIE